MPRLNDLEQSPYAAPAQRRPLPPEALAYTRQYAQRIRDFGNTSKESWIQRLWNHMFTRKQRARETARDREIAAAERLDFHQSLAGVDATRSTEFVIRSAPLPPPETKADDVIKAQVLPPIKPPEEDGVEDRGSRNSKLLRTSSERMRLPQVLVDSPYLPKREKSVHRMLPNAPGSRDARPKKGSNARSKKFKPYVSGPEPPETWRPSPKLVMNKLALEKKAKETADKAIKNSHIFTCDSPYPVSVFVRLSLRRRGWVEKLGSKAEGKSTSWSNNTHRVEVNGEEDYDPIVEQDIPQPWEEDHGMYAMMSRMVRHYPARFIWGLKNVNNMILRSETIVNHWPKARYFSSKVLLAGSLKDLPWLNSSDPLAFFPRCYVLSEDEKDDIIDDFRMTMCLCILKWTIDLYRKEEDEESPKAEENGPSRTVTFIHEDKPPTDINGNIAVKMALAETSNSEQHTVESPKPIERETPIEGGGDLADVKMAAEEQNNPPAETSNKPEAVASPQPDSNPDSKNNNSEPVVPQSATESSSGNIKPIERESHLPMTDNENESKIKDAFKAENESRINKTLEVKNESRIENHLEAENESRIDQAASIETAPETVPPLQKRRSSLCSNSNYFPRPRRSGKDIPAKALDWALSHVTRFIRDKRHDDLDSRRKGLSDAQWTQLWLWFAQISKHGAHVCDVTSGKLREGEKRLKQMNEHWPQMDIDGRRNLWIIKPGEQSKGKGIEFCDSLDDCLKFVNNTTTAGTYVVQKYVERPLLIYQCKFDLRQWFLVTDFQPLTIWFYKESYLRICSQKYSYANMHESVHLSNVAVQQNYDNDKSRNENLPDDNFMTSSKFKKYLSETGAPDAWAEIIYPGMKEAIINTLVACQEVSENRKCAFELYGADFILSEEYRPYLLEVNCCPGMAPTSREKARLCAEVIEDTIKVVLDRRDDRNAATGAFELIHKEQNAPSFKCLDTKIVTEGTRIKKVDYGLDPLSIHVAQVDLQKYSLIDQRAEAKHQTSANQAEPTK